MKTVFPSVAESKLRKIHMTPPKTHAPGDPLTTLPRVAAPYAQDTVAHLSGVSSVAEAVASARARRNFIMVSGVQRVLRDRLRDTTRGGQSNKN